MFATHSLTPTTIIYYLLYFINLLQTYKYDASESLFLLLGLFAAVNAKWNGQIRFLDYCKLIS
jgi:predicted membrane protein